MSMAKPLAVLIVEDAENDARLVVRTLEKSGYQVTFEQVETAAGMRAALEKQTWEVVISDYSMPQFDGPAALALLQKMGINIPFIIVSGTLGEETAVDMIKAGAHDYLMKGNLMRLASAVERELAQSEVQRKRKEAEEELLRSGQRYRLLFEKNPLPMWVYAQETLAFLAANQAAIDHYGYQKDEFLHMTIKDIRPAEELIRLTANLSGPETHREVSTDWKHIKKDGSLIDVEIISHDIIWDGQPARMVLANDITRRRQAEAEIRQHLSELEMLYQSGLAFSQLASPKAIAKKMIGLLDQKMNWHHTAIRLYDPRTKTLELLTFNTSKLTNQDELRVAEKRFRSIQRPDQGLSGWVIRHGEVVRSNNLQNDPRYFETFPGLHSGLYVPIKIGERVIGVISIESEQAEAFSESDERLTMTLATQAAVAMDNALLLADLKYSNAELSQAYDATIAGWSGALDLRDKETEGHSQRVTDMTLELAKGMGLNEEELVHVRRGALLHDIGKMGIPDDILLKAGALTTEEWTIMRKHPEFAYNLLSPIAYLQSALDIPYCHHEKWDGTGYPRGLKGEQIPLAARIFAVVDVWDALSSDRPYRKAWPAKKVREHIRSLSGTHFDPDVVARWLKTVTIHKQK